MRLRARYEHMLAVTFKESMAQKIAVSADNKLEKTLPCH